MGHKRSKKDQVLDNKTEEKLNEQTSANNVEHKKPKKSKKKKYDVEVADDDQPPKLTREVEDVVPENTKLIKKERKKKSKKTDDKSQATATDSAPEQIISNERQDLCENVTELEQQVNSNENKVEKTRGRKNNNLEEEKVIDWPECDLTDLFTRMEAAIPDNDSMAFTTRVEKLNWDDIAFKNYTAEECKSTWLLVQKRLRRFRLLSELTNDAKEWLSKPWTKFHGKNRHPDMPRRPLSTYMIFYHRKRDKVIAENPGLDVTEISKIIAQMYKALTPAKKEKFNREAAEKKKLYEVELEEFYRQHPEVSRFDKASHHKQTVETGPKKPNTPFNLFYESQLKSLESNMFVDKHTFKEQCKDQWKHMSDKKKLVWINWAADEETKYQDELKQYISRNPDYIPTSAKPVLNREEKLLKERMSGKPSKPPNSAYSLYSKQLLQSEDIKEVHPRDRMSYIAEKWKNCSEEEKKSYNDEIARLREQYKLDYASYLESLTEEKREEEMRNALPKKKRTKAEEALINNKKLKLDADAEKIAQEEEENAKNKNKDDKKLSPFAKPPYWSKMKKEEKRTFKNAILKLKQHLDSRFEKYIHNRETDSSEDESDDSEDCTESTEDSS